LQKKILITATDIFAISSQKQFEKTALKVFRYQHENNLVYREFCDLMKVESQKIKTLNRFRFTHSVFKSHAVVSNTNLVENTFTSSGTTGLTTSKHLVTDTSIYTESYQKDFQFYGNIEDYVVLALLPSYLEREGSSLIYMVEDLIQLSNHDESGFICTIMTS
jgi:phenylacetate-coenzyme A ligase PaaK-like adenylate-forming protein